MSPWLFNIYMDSVVRETNARVLGRGLHLKSPGEDGYEINQLLFADDTALVADSEDKLKQLVYEFGKLRERRKLKVNVSKSKVMRCTKNANVGRLNVLLNGVALDEVDKFNYLGACVAAKTKY